MSNDPDILQYTLSSPLTPTVADAVARAQDQAISRGPAANYPSPDSELTPQFAFPFAESSNGSHHHQHHRRHPTTSANAKSISSVLVLGGVSDVSAATIQLLSGALPDCTILSTNSRQHNRRLVAELGTACIARNGSGSGNNRTIAKLMDAVKADCQDAAGTRGAASGGDDGVDAIVDAVGVVEAAESEEDGQARRLLDLLSPDGPRVYTTVATMGR
ncbi:hypothetical protein MMYC01_203191 [Madurella mycetomatis]|uniref:Uncharacterized protein n=1 Tax=Madurella mycetomatis TaxID=100816 RepID=A0A175VU84_9PEZI|nr:hypothetical protein MMYC01_208927 [Madurella mycetomatis]KXX81243.1 hypothetical protein MMYC01_203191 [Madurella mycetomatis]